MCLWIGAVDRPTLQQLSYILGKLFWADLEQHHPGISSLRLPDDVARAWKQRLQVKASAGNAADGTKVTVTSPTQATVGYNIVLAGQTALGGQSGTAVLQDGTWKVGLASFCGLLTLEAGGKTKGLPAQCQTTG